MSIDEEKIIIYQLMHELIEERRELSKQYFDLKSKLDQIEERESGSLKQKKTLFQFLKAKRLSNKITTSRIIKLSTIILLIEYQEQLYQF